MDASGLPCFRVQAPYVQFALNVSWFLVREIELISQTGYRKELHPQLDRWHAITFSLVFNDSWGICTPATFLCHI